MDAQRRHGPRLASMLKAIVGMVMVWVQTGIRQLPRRCERVRKTDTKRIIPQLSGLYLVSRAKEGLMASTTEGLMSANAVSVMGGEQALLAKT